MPTYLERSYNECEYAKVFQYMNTLPDEEKLYALFLSRLTQEQKELLAMLEEQQDLRMQALYREIFQQGFYTGIRCRKMVENGQLRPHEQLAKL